MKYYVTRTSKETGKVQIKQLKTIYQWVDEDKKDICHQFSRQGAKSIVDRENNGIGARFFVYGMVKAN